MLTLFAIHFAIDWVLKLNPSKIKLCSNYSWERTVNIKQQKKEEVFDSV